MCEEVISLHRQPVSGPALMLDQAGRAQVAQPLGKHAGRHVWHPRREFAVIHRARAKLPHDSQRPASAKHIEQREQGSEREVWSQAEVRAFLRAAADDRLHAAWRLSLYGLRRGEVLGLRWSDIDLKGKTLTVNQGRVLVDCEIRVEPPKSQNGKRTLPLDDALVKALTALRKQMTNESQDAGTAYRPGWRTWTGTPQEMSTWSPTS